MGVTCSKSPGQGATRDNFVINGPYNDPKGWAPAKDEPEYVGAPKPANEDERLKYLQSRNILDTAAEKRFDDITKLCCMIFKVPIALVSLVDHDRQWFKSVQGLDARQTDRRSSFCAWTLLPKHPELLIVENAFTDARFARNPLVTGPPDIRFYAGCPLVASNGFVMGSLCIIDRKPRAFDAEQCNVLANMGEMVVREIEKDAVLASNAQRTAMLSQENTQLLRAIDCFTEGIMLCNLSVPKWPILFLNEAWEKLTGMSRDDGYSRDFWDMFKVRAGPRSEKECAAFIERGASFEMDVILPAGTGATGAELHLQFRSANVSTVDASMPLIGIPSILPTAEDGPRYYFAIVRDKAADVAPRGVSSSGFSSGTHASGFNANDIARAFDDIHLGPLLGKGSFGRVYRGHWNGAQVAVKILDHVQAGGEADKKLAVEAMLCDRMNFPNVVQTYKYVTRKVGSDPDSGEPLLETWLVLEFCNKGPLGDAIERGWFRRKDSLFDSALAPILATAKEVASAMSYLHNCGILHGDLTSNNVLLTGSEKDARRYTAKVADFGLSRILPPEAMTIQTRNYGTVTHMPPELLNDGTMSRATDVYSFGVILWELYCGQRPYSGMSAAQIIHHVTSGKQLDMPRSTPPALRQLIARCMAPQPEARPTFPDILKQLAALEAEFAD